MPYLDKPEIDALLACPDRSTSQGRRDHGLLLFLYNSGARTDEAAQLTADHLGDIPVASEGAMTLLPPDHDFGLGFAVCKQLGGAPVPGSTGTYFWGVLAGTTFFLLTQSSICLLV